MDSNKMVNYIANRTKLGIDLSNYTKGIEQYPYQINFMQTQIQIIKQELVNSIVHGFGIIFGIVSIPILIAFAIKSDNTSGIIGAAIYGFCFLQLLLFSTTESACSGKTHTKFLITSVFI
jgi:predicted membrane channel-forming protein YqfA (hemolysin III family)